MDEKYNVARIGWENQNDVFPVILLSKSDRDRLGLNEGDPVKVYLIEDEIEVGVISAVGKQFKDLLGKENICSVSGQLAEKLRIIVGSEVNITRNLTESEYKQFQKDCKQAVFFGFE